MPRTFRVEIRKDCRVCGSPLPPRFRTFCRPQCRNRYYASQPETKAYRAEHQRKRYDKNATQQRADKLPCAICGRFYRRPIRHANQRHGVTEREYKESAGLDRGRGVITPEARERMAEHTRANGTIYNLESGAPYRWSADNPPPAYERSPQTIERLREHGKNLPHHNKHKK